MIDVSGLFGVGVYFFVFNIVDVVLLVILVINGGMICVNGGGVEIV